MNLLQRQEWKTICLAMSANWVEITNRIYEEEQAALFDVE
jgi:hypothetical protein